MRIWSLHPEYLDRQGLVACWREPLLAQAVLAERTRGYRSHPQLDRFRDVDDPLSVIGAYLSALAVEADERGYRFDRTRIDRPGEEHSGSLMVTTGQLTLEWSHLTGKLRVRDPERLARWARVAQPAPHPIFRVVEGGVAEWERARPAG